MFGWARNSYTSENFFIDGGNAGYVSKVPILDGVMNDQEGLMNPDPKNEKILSFEAGMGFRSEDRAVSFDLSLYHTTWKDRGERIFIQDLLGEDQDGIVTLLGLDQRHMGIEAQAAYQPNDLLRFDAAASFGKWKYLDDVTGQFNFGGGLFTETIYIKDLKVADAPQSQLAYAVSVFPIDNSQYNDYDGDHDADDAEVFLGQPRMFNLGFEIRF